MLVSFAHCPLVHVSVHSKEGQKRNPHKEDIGRKKLLIPGEVKQQMFRSPPTKGEPRTTHTTLVRVHQ